MNVFELFAKLGLDTSEYDEGLDKSESKGRDFGETLSTVVATGAAIGTAAIAATAAAVVSLSTSFAEGIQETAAYGDEIEKNAQKLGLSNSAYQEWDYVLNIAGTSMSNLSTGIKTLTNKIDDAKNGNEDAIASFESLGISLEDLETMSREDIFEATIYGFTELEDSAERAALANDIFGRSGQELTPLFNMTEEEISSLIDTANEYGMVMSDEAVEASAGFQDSLTTLEGTMNGLKNNLLAEFLPSVSTVMDGLSAIFAGDDSGLESIREGVSNFTSKLSEVLPEFIEIGASIISSLATSIIENAPSLLSSILSALGTIVNAIIDNSDMIIDAAVEVLDIFVVQILDPTQIGKLTQAMVDIVVKLGSAISDALPVLVPAIVSVITEIVTVLTRADNLAMIMDAVLEILDALSYAWLQSAPQIANIIIPTLWNILLAVIAEIPNLIETLLNVLIRQYLMLGETLLGLFGVTWEDFKAYFASFGIDTENIVGSILNNIVSIITTAWNSFLSLANTALNTALDNLKAFLNNPKEYIMNTLTNIKNFFTTTWNNIKNTTTTVLTNIKNFIPNAMNSAKNTLTSTLDAIKSKFTSVFDNAKTTVENAINFIKNLFNFEWSLPKIKLPHFSITGSFDLLATPPKYPSVSVSWYKKAMEQPYLLDGATIFGASGGKLLGGGEAGSELVIGTDKLMSMMKQAVGTGNRDITINVYGAEGQDVRLLAKEVSRELQNLVDDKSKVFA